MRDEDKPAIRDLPLFRAVTTQTFDGLMASTYAQSFPPQLELFRQGDRADFLHILVEGAVELHAEWNGRDAVMAVVRPVSSFILAACLRDQPALMSARTLERSRILMLPAVDLRAAIRRDPELAAAVMGELARGYRGMVRQVKNLKLRGTRERLAAWLLTQSRREGGAASFVLPVEKRHLASYLGMTAESLSRTFAALKKEGIALDGARVIITDRAALAQAAGQDPLIDEMDASEDPGEVMLPSLGRPRGG
ncbi:CRP/FNR family transcriptional regulator, transcriptional activator FtrB [Paracoccus aminovorans]|uniref:CRP/FNR family transcriptional regulator, transcriptional activator FtrB n=1 Tax=Paracoccus aminovorans TaxID=34004 RepID=A0A1I2ZVH6_9RHOB|nr:helix-turn-helix domain-containing protein [Paracoccus aminovorans]CQR84385.1 transcriptional activator NarR [Paracoccus aminovorans]SFH41857.1 CRP/FNR family transcriptional regulator, transcriptional activator FtrB [Paracoccus aminovorans]